MQKTYKTDRLRLIPLQLSDAIFIYELLNTEGWIKFIGDRDIKSIEDAQKTLDNPSINYWVIKSKEQNASMGLISFIKRDYLESNDIGFAFLPGFTSKGYAFEATEQVLIDLLKDPKHKNILAATATDNLNSIKLITKLGFRFNREIVHENEKLFLYSISADSNFP